MNIKKKKGNTEAENNITLEDKGNNTKVRKVLPSDLQVI